MKKEEKIKKKIKIILTGWGLFLFLSILATNYLVVNDVIYQEEIVQDRELSLYFDYFKKSAVNYGVQVNYDNLVVGFVDRYPKSDWLALCQKIGSVRFVTFLKSHFEKAPMEERYALMVHELGHCVLNLPHKSGYHSDGCPLSIMHPTDNMFGCFFKNEEYYFKELFNVQ